MNKKENLSEELWKLFDFVNEDVKKFDEEDLDEIVEARRQDLIKGLSGLNPEILDEDDESEADK